MDRIRIKGGRPLSGDIVIGGAKDAALPLMAAGLLTEERLELGNVPRLADIETMSALLAQHGIAVEPEGRSLRLGGRITDTGARSDIVRKMRASVLVLGPLLARVGEARVSLPGGCAMGTRPVDLHLKGLEQMGAVIRLRGRVYPCLGARAAARSDDRAAVRLGGGDRESADGRGPGRGRDGAGECGAGAGDRRPGRLPGRDGRADRRRRHRPADDRGGGAAARRTARDHSRSDRDRHVHLRRGDHRRIGAPAGRTARASRRGGADAAARRGWRSRPRATRCSSGG